MEYRKNLKLKRAKQPPCPLTALIVFNNDANKLKIVDLNTQLLIKAAQVGQSQATLVQLVGVLNNKNKERPLQHRNLSKSRQQISSAYAAEMAGKSVSQHLNAKDIQRLFESALTKMAVKCNQIRRQQLPPKQAKKRGSVSVDSNPFAYKSDIYPVQKEKQEELSVPITPRVRSHSPRNQLFGKKLKIENFKKRTFSIFSVDASKRPRQWQYQEDEQENFFQKAWNLFFS